MSKKKLFLIPLTHQQETLVLMNLLKFTGGIFSLVFGIWFFWYLVKHPIDPEQDISKSMLQGYISAVGAIVLGFLLIYSELDLYFHN